MVPFCLWPSTRGTWRCPCPQLLRRRRPRRATRLRSAERRGFYDLPSYDAGALPLLVTFWGQIRTATEEMTTPNYDNAASGSDPLAGRANARSRNSKCRGVGCCGNLAGGAWRAESHMHAARPGHCRSLQRVSASSEPCDSPRPRTMRPPPGRWRGPWPIPGRLRPWWWQKMAETVG